MRFALAGLAALVLAACAHDRGPAWPKPYVAADAPDGGESLAPKPKPRAIAAAEPEAAAEEPAAPKPAAAAPAPAAPAPAATAPLPTDDDDAIDAGEVIIEIED